MAQVPSYIARNITSGDKNNIDLGFDSLVDWVYEVDGIKEQADRAQAALSFINEAKDKGGTGDMWYFDGQSYWVKDKLVELRRPVSRFESQREAQRSARQSLAQDNQTAALTDTGTPKPDPEPKPDPAPQQQTAQEATGGGGSGGGSNASTAAPDPAVDSVGTDATPTSEMSDEEIDAYLKKTYGYMSWAFDHPELGPILRKAAKEGWGEHEVGAAVRQTEWWQENEASARNFERRLVEESGDVEAEIATKKLDIKLAAAQLGVPLTEERARAIATDYVKFGWTENELRSALIAEMEYIPGSELDLGGTLGDTQESLEKTARDYFVPVTDQTLHDWSAKIVEGMATDSDYRRYVEDMAASRFPHLKPYIEKGINLSTFFEPYRQTVARMLELNPADVDLADDRWSQIIDFVPEEGGDRRPMTLYEVQDWVRHQDEWKYTDQANRNASNLSRRLLETFGAI